MLNLKFYKGKDFYSDGDVEDELLNIFKNNINIEDVLKNDNRWPILYHLSPLRRNLLEWYNFNPNAKLLEVGAGCGALTPFFCEKVKKVTAIELSLKRAKIIEYRCNKKFDNLEIIVGNFNDIKFSELYEYITLIGVLEYSGKFIQSLNPYKSFLEKIASLLEENGKVIIAIENKYGLKYWSGAPEDHTANIFENIEDYNNIEIQTFGKEELIELLKSVGFNKIDFYYPLPDYKLPTVIYSDFFLPDECFCYDSNTPNYDRDRYILFNEKFAFKGIIRNKKFDFFANSFLVIAQ